MDGLRASELARLHHLAATYKSQTPSDYLGLPSTSAADLYWRWATDEACRTCAAILAERERQAERDQANGITTYRVQKKGKHRA